jgi:hypothetical protein
LLHKRKEKEKNQETARLAKMKKARMEEAKKRYDE